MKNLFYATLCGILLATGVLTSAGAQNGTQTKLPAPAERFITKHFSGVQILNSKVDKDFPKGVTHEVKLSNGFEIDFNGKGEWIEIDGNRQAIPDGIIPSRITSHVAKKFPGQKITHIEHNWNGYEVDLTNDQELHFDSKGNFKGFDN